MLLSSILLQAAAGASLGKLGAALGAAIAVIGAALGILLCVLTLKSEK